MIPLKYSPQIESPPIRSAPLEVRIEPLAGTVTFTKPFTHSCKLEPS